MLNHHLPTSPIDGSQEPKKLDNLQQNYYET